MLFLKNRSVPRNISQCHWYFEGPIKIKPFSFRPCFGFGKPQHGQQYDFKRTDAMALLGKSCSDLSCIFSLLFYIAESLVSTKTEKKIYIYFQIQWHYSNTENGQKRRWRGRLKVIYVPLATITSSTGPLFFLWHWQQHGWDTNNKHFKQQTGKQISPSARQWWMGEQVKLQ